MNKKNSLFALVALTLALMIIIAIILLLQLLQGGTHVTKKVVLTESGITQVELEYSANGLKPGDSRDYTLDITAKVAEVYKLELAFHEKADGGLRNFINVRLECGTDSAEYTLDELFDGQTVIFTSKIDEQTATVIKVIFTMPEEIGNEAQGAESDFTIMLTAEKA